jgi:hypothetical protein
MDQTTLPTAAAPSIFASILSILLGALAAGVIVCFASISMRVSSEVLMILVGAGLGVFLRWQGFAGKRAMLCAALATSLAFAYAQFLFGAVRIAQTLGLPMRDVLSKAGAALIGDIAIGNLHAKEWIVLGLAIALAITTAAWPARKK